MTVLKSNSLYTLLLNKPKLLAKKFITARKEKAARRIISQMPEWQKKDLNLYHDSNIKHDLRYFAK